MSIDTVNIKNKMAKDTFIYMSAKVAEGIIGILTLSLYSYYFVPEIYENYNLIMVTVNISTLVAVEWLRQSAYRYINKFSAQDKMKTFFSTVFITWIASVGVLMFVCFSIILILNASLERSTTVLLFLGTFMLLSFSGSNILLSILTSLRRIKLNILMSVLAAAFKLGFTSFLVFIWNPGIISAVTSIVVIDSLVILIIAFRLKIYSYLSLRFFSKDVLKEFAVYGTPLIGLGLSMSLLNLSDRYLLKVMVAPGEMGIYSANYSIASAVFNILNISIMRGIYPIILKNWNKDNKKATEELLSHAVRIYILIALPSAVGLATLSHVLSRMLAPEYIAGSNVIIWVAAGMFFLGLTEYNNKSWELNSNTSPILINSLISCAFNIVSNLIFIPLYGYRAAAVNTFTAYLLLFLLSYIRGRRFLKWNIPLLRFAKIFTSVLLMGITVVILTCFMGKGLQGLLIFIPSGALVYGTILYASGEIKTEVNQAYNWLSQKLKLTLKH